MAPPKLKCPTRLVLDFDCTLTVVDTMPVLGSMVKEPKISWEEISDAYMRDYQEYKDTPYPWKNYDDEEYSGWLAARKRVEERSAHRVQKAGFFKGVTLGDVKGAVARCLNDGSLQFRHRWLELFELFLAEASSSKISIVSVNWSETFIRHALWEACRISDHPQRHAICQYIQQLEIHANEIEGLDAPQGSSGRVCRSPEQDIRSSDDKLRYLPEVGPPPADESRPLVVYVGDSPTDFDCLLAAHVGIWIQDVPVVDFQKVFKNTFKPLNLVPQRLEAKEVDIDSICWTWSLGNIVDLLKQTETG